MAKSILEAVAALGPNHGRKPKRPTMVAAGFKREALRKRVKRFRAELAEMIDGDPTPRRLRLKAFRRLMERR